MVFPSGFRLEDYLPDSCGSAWSACSSCYGLGASLGILGVPHLLIVVHRGCGWKDYPRVWVASNSAVTADLASVLNQ